MKKSCKEEQLVQDKKRCVKKSELGTVAQPVIPATWKAEIGRIGIQRQSGKNTLSQ
jgi:hypothetical protein